MAERPIPAEVLTLIQQRKVHPAIFIHVDFPTLPRYLWTGKGTYTDDSAQAWEGVGAIISIGAVHESIDTAASGIQVTLDSLDPDIASEIVDSAYQGEGGEIMLGFWNPATGRVVFVSDPIWKGVLDSDSFEMSADKTKLEMYCEHRMVDILRKREYRYTHRDQLALHPGTVDTALSRMVSIQDLSIPWGRTQV